MHRLALIALVAVTVGLFVQLVACSSSGADASRMLFSMEDPPDDDYGPGTYIYPTHHAFSPHRGILDLRRFEVFDTHETVDFYFSFAVVTNPWHAPEGFSHQLIDLYIDCIERAGRDRPLRDGPRVRFPSESGWDYLIRVVAWDGCRLFRADDPSNAKGTKDGVSAVLLQDGKTIKVSVRRDHFEVEPSPRWQYFCLIGSQDVFGEDEYRPVMREAGLWHFGGAEDERLAPYVIDLLAPAKGHRSQQSQLLSYDSGRGTHALLYPVGGQSFSVATLVLSVVIAVLLLGVGIGLAVIRRMANRTPPNGR
ncbi:MAG: glucodextranase DOMON-like domain-containing protein [Bacillota bacterium]|nr:glucodextranase DOMON-like domain-containing protein [Bacillota bacterium]HPZ54488.1 glucodextranase DOMON-like domain-containing protein [Bacillota bacterium]HQD17824.1 glucodextranase DOMON-like domain-containing protein [Bacillota bacterium]